MRRLLAVLAAAVAAALCAPLVDAAAPVRITGGGEGTFAADLDRDGDIDGSHFGVGAVLGGGSAKGHFECLMAGNADILGLPLMAVQGKVTGGTAAGTTATLTGTATVNLGNGTIFTEVPYSVVLHSGGPGTASLQLTVIGAFDGVAGDTVSGNNNYDLPPETVATGRVSIR